MMLDLKKIERAEIRFLEGTNTQEDIDILKDWYNSPEYQADLEVSKKELEEIIGRQLLIKKSELL